MVFRGYLVGYIECQIVCASAIMLLNEISSKVEIFEVNAIDEITVRIRIRRNDFSIVRQIANKHDSKAAVVMYIGPYWFFRKSAKRLVLLIGLLILFVLTLYLPTRVLFISVSGNNRISTQYILDAADSCGVTFGASRKLVRSEEVKNALMDTIDELQWACINTKGCTAEISVQERIDNNEISTSESVDIIAARDGIITEMTVFQGTPLCSVGEIVKKGQILVSGYSDLGLLIKIVPADAEIRAETLRSQKIVALPSYTEKTELRNTKTKYSLLIGKKLIKISKDSGISHSGCDRIYEAKYITLPGGFRLPVALVSEKISSYKCAIRHVSQNDEHSWLYEASDILLRDQMVAGEIIRQTNSLHVDEQYYLHTVYRCVEQIGTKQIKEIYNG